MADEFRPPETIKQGLQESMLEERKAADWYRRRGLLARLKDDKTTADLYEHIAREEDHHHEEFKTRADTLPFDKDVKELVELGMIDLNTIIGVVFGEGAIPINARETRKAPCQGCRIDPTKPLEPGNVMATTKDAIGLLNPQEVRDWCSEIIELHDGRCERVRTIKKAARECKEKYPNNTEEFFRCFIPAFAGITQK